MKALFDIRGKQLIVEADSTVPAGVVKVHSLDSFASWVGSLDEAPQNGAAPVTPRSKPRRSVVAASATEMAEMVGLALSQPPEGGWKDDKGERIVLNQRGITRERVALAMSKHASRLSVEEQALVSQRYGLLDVKRPHSLYEVAAMANADYSTTSYFITKALKRIGLKFAKRVRHG